MHAPLFQQSFKLCVVFTIHMPGARTSHNESSTVGVCSRRGFCKVTSRALSSMTHNHFESVKSSILRPEPYLLDLANQIPTDSGAPARTYSYFIPLDFFFFVPKFQPRCLFRQCKTSKPLMTQNHLLGKLAVWVTEPKLIKFTVYDKKFRPKFVVKSSRECLVLLKILLTLHPSIGITARSPRICKLVIISESFFTRHHRRFLCYTYSMQQKGRGNCVAIKVVTPCKHGHMKEFYFLINNTPVHI